MNRVQQMERIKELTEKIENWGKYNSQSNPGAVMELRFMKQELKKLLKSNEVR